MKLNKMLIAQSKLDKFTLERSGIVEYPHLQILLALRVELGELSQEWGGFKYWKKSQKGINREALVEEWADCMHFGLSLANYRDDLISNRVIEQLVRLYVTDYNIYQIFDRAFKNGSLASIIALGYKLGLDDEEMEAAYFNKNAKNWERMKGDY